LGSRGSTTIRKQSQIILIEIQVVWEDQTKKSTKAGVSLFNKSRDFSKNHPKLMKPLISLKRSSQIFEATERLNQNDDQNTSLLSFNRKSN
jgi:hypothetical protein